MAPLLNPTARRLAVAAYRRLSIPAPAEAPFSCRSTRERYSSSLVDVSGGFDDMLANASTQRFYVVGGKGGVGKTSIAASLAVKFANQGEPTLIASMDPTHSLGDSFEQSMTNDGKIVRINGFDSLFATEIGHVIKKDPSEARSWIHNILGKMGLGIPADPIINSKLDEILNRLPPGCEEEYAISELIRYVELQGGDKFRRIVLDTASTGHTLKLLSATNWIDKGLSVATTAVNAVFSQPLPKTMLRKEQIDSASAGIQEALEKLRQQIARVREVLYNPESTEYITVTIPTMMAVTESSRFNASLRTDGAHTRRLVVNQVLPPSTSDCRFCAAKRREEARAFKAIRDDSELGGLKIIQAPLLDLELKGVPALRFLGDSVWK